MKLYRIKDWDKHFENDRSRSRKHCSFVCVPNKQHGMGFSRVMAEPDGSAIYGIWHLIVGACSQQESRHGWLTSDGEHAGSPWGVDDLALKFRRPASEIQRALDFLSSDKVGWIICYKDGIFNDLPDAHREVTAESPSGHLEEKGREEKGREVETAPLLIPEVPKDTAESLMKAWNDVGIFPAIRGLSEKRKKAASARLKDAFFSAHWRDALARASKSSFCLGQNDRGWKADFDWFLQPDVCLKITEGKYDNRNGGGPIRKPVVNAI